MKKLEKKNKTKINCNKHQIMIWFILKYSNNYNMIFIFENFNWNKLI